MGIRVIVFLVAVLAVSAWLCKSTADKVFDELKSKESFDEVDYYSMQEYSDQSSELVFSSLKSGKLDKLKAKMISSDGLENVAEFDDWSKADFSHAVGLGAGSLSPAPDENGRMDISERFFVDTEDTKCVFFIETVTSRWGRTYDGISAVSVTTYSYFDAEDYDWSGEESENSACAGELFWIKNQASESEGLNESPNN